ncbi:MAG TPA: tRNA dihydrouridine synthase DusB [Candidatus Hydrogenedentes bacterium]|nr:tRNA dihydrouridine synthase DusB [Candidatus Hydrogenedentota bacterium]HIJ73612.1 tRNA dihydrouridine synthase DusB [Candidatus Hydrogenedentota bacterium]
MMRIGHIELNKPLALAPMDDVSDPPFRMICKENGTDLLYTEFASCEALIRNVKSQLKKTEFSESERPIGIQLYGSAESSMREAAGIAEQAEPDFIDINCGCWVRKIANRGDGAGLLRDLHKLEAVIRAVVGATRLPVTLKTRLGWDADNIVILDVARLAEQCGIQMLAVHCRTRVQAFKGKADWTWLERVRNVVSIPLIGNGDVTQPEHAKQMFDLGCDGVMIGRGAITNPWIFNQIKHYLATGERLPEPTLAERIDMCLRHLKAEAEYKGERRAVLEHRKHYAGYLKGQPNIAKLRAELMQFSNVGPIEARLNRFLEASCQSDLGGCGQCVKNPRLPGTD